nr:unnamed protein product [Digitaria exilis]
MAPPPRPPCQPTAAVACMHASPSGQGHRDAWMDRRRRSIESLASFIPLGLPVPYT